MNQPRKRVIRSGVNRACSKLRDPLFNYINDKRVNWPVCYVPGLNLNKNPWVQQWDVENVMNLYRVFPYHCDMPKPLLPPGLLPRTVFHDGDPGVDMITTKKYLQDEAERMSEHYVKEQKKSGTEEICDFSKKFEKEENFEGTKLPKFLADMADHLEMDPDPLFDGRYNYYYTGGSLDSIHLNEQNILLFPFSDELIAAPLISKGNSLWKVNFKKASKSELYGKVYEIRHRIDSSCCRILTRFKHKVAVHTMTEKKGKLTLFLREQTTSKLPLIGSDLDPFDVNKACTLNMMGCLRIWDLEKSVSRTHSFYSTKKNSILADTWRSIRYHDNPNMLSLTDRCCVSYIDLRRNVDEPVLTMCPGNHLEVCDDVISLEIPSQKEYRHYVGTYHKLFTLDSRTPQDPVQQTWTHQMESAPLVGNVIVNNDEEVITLSSQKSRDSVIILNTWQQYDQPHSFHPPYSPSHILDTLKEAHHLGKCLDPLLKRRLEMTTTGSQLIKDDTGNLFHLLQNSVGDIFYQGISYPQKFERDSLVNCHAYYALEMWEKQMLSQRQGIVPLVMSDQVNVEEAFKCFTRTDLKYKQPAIEKTDEIPKWKQSVKKLMSYTDVLAPEILAAWEISDTSENIPQAQPHQKVLNWLTMAPEEPAKEAEVEDSEVDDDFSMPMVNSQELVSVSQQVRDPEVDDDYPIIIPDPVYDDASSYFLPVKVRNNKKDTKKKSSHVAGF